MTAQTRLVAIALVMTCLAGSVSASPALFLEVQKNRSKALRPVVTTSVRSAARKLAQAWVDGASAETIDRLAYRSIAFAGMVPGVYVVLDGHRMSATQALTDSSLTILGKKTLAEDAGAIRNTVYALMEIAEGRLSSGARR